MLSLYRGLGASVIGIIPYSGCDLMLFSFFKEQFHHRWPDAEPGMSTLFLCGAMSTTCAQVVSYPLQLVRTRLQASNKYKGIIDCISKTVRNDGFKGLYRGIGTNFVKALPAMTLSWGTYESVKKVLVEKAVRRNNNHT
jgi:solute carrier family 25 (mitochondrial phosphate transporter), member 23/24/25/41